MDRWPIVRSWIVIGGDGSRQQFHTSDLQSIRACCLLGTAGLGKTYELKGLAELDRAAGRDVRSERLALVGQTPEGLRKGLDRLLQGTTTETTIYLDALDEVPVPVQMGGLIVERWIREALAGSRPRVRISCRSAVWPAGLESAMQATYGKADVCVAFLQELTEANVRAVATARGIDGTEFLGAISAAGVGALSEQPLTLEMLLRVYSVQGRLPGRRSDLFRTGMEHLASERAERLDTGTALDLTPADVLEASERLACLTLLSGRESIDLADQTGDSSLGVHELGSLPGSARPLDGHFLRQIRRCGLYEGQGPHRYLFGHRQFAEYLAGRRLARLPLHQARTLLASGLGWAAGVAGPLRETAAFAAMESTDIAAWIADHAPEIIGRSDVGDDILRRRALLALVDKFRRHEFTDADAHGMDVELTGLRYLGAEADLLPLLRKRGADNEDLLAIAVRLTNSWEFKEMSDELASLALDPAAPIHARTSAGYALSNWGTREAKVRLLPLIHGSPDDTNEDLKGLALRCNWPDSLTVPQLFSVLTPPRVPNYMGAYDGFLTSLVRDGFDAPGHRQEGLAWAQGFVTSHQDLAPAVQLARGICTASLAELRDSRVAASLAQVLLTAAAEHSPSPLGPPHGRTTGGAESKTPLLAAQPDARRTLVDALVTAAPNESDLWMAVVHGPALWSPEDFPWLVARATDDTRPMLLRERYANLARLVPWWERAEWVDACFAAYDTEPIASRLAMPPFIVLDSKEARAARDQLAEAKRWNAPRKPPRVSPPPHERVAQCLDLCETKDPRFFNNLMRELTLKENSTHYEITRFISATPGWATASADNRRRIVDSAKRMLPDAGGDAARARSEPLSTWLNGPISAVWIVLQEDPAWIDGRSDAWWGHWAWYLLRELHPATHDEPEEPKRALMARLLTRVPGAVRDGIRYLAKSTDSHAGAALGSLLGLLAETDDPDLDALLCDDLTRGAIAEDRVGDVARFVLGRSAQLALVSCVTLLDQNAVSISDTTAVRAAVALLAEYSEDCWDRAFLFLRRRPDLSARVLREYALDREFRRPQEGKRSLMPARYMGELAAFLIGEFPPESDADDSAMVYTIGPDEAARILRGHVLTWLSNQSTAEAVEALRTLERTFGARYAWLRRSRSHAERAHRLASWTPVPPASVAEILADGDRRLIRTGRDALDGIEAAIDAYRARLRVDGELEDLWNLPKGGRASPKSEERLSDKLCGAIREYFRKYAVIADREVQISRRKLSKARGGIPGSEVDVLFRAPARGTVGGESIGVPVEVKWAHNAEARTGMKDQLVTRYMRDLATDFGAYVVAWAGTGTGGKQLKPLWPSLTDLKGEMPQLVADATSAFESIDVRAIVLDASLPRVGPVKRGSSKSKRKAKSASLRKGAARLSVAKGGPIKRKGSSRKPSRKPAKKRR